MRVAPLAVILAGTSLMVSGQTGVKNGEWPHWGADLGNTKYSALDQINRDTVKNLRVAWRWKADNFGPRPQNNLEATPLMVGGVLYTTAGTRPSVAAIDGATGETLWTYRLDEGRARRHGAAQRVARRRVLDRRQAAAHHPHHARLPHGVARCEDRPARSVVRPRRRHRPLRRFRSADAEGRHDQLDVAGRRRQQRDRRRRRAAGRHRAAVEGKHEGLRARATTSAAASASGRSTRFRIRENSATTRG